MLLQKSGLSCSNIPSSENANTLEFVIASKNTQNVIFNETDEDIIVTMLNEEWGSQFTATREIVRQRLASGQDIILAYDFARPQDAEYIENVYGIKFNRSQKIPIGIIETIDIYTDGKYTSIPTTYESLTNNGHWRPKLEKSDTLMLVNANVLPERRGKKGAGEAKKLISAVKDFIKKETSYQYIWTFTPDFERIKVWHIMQGAKDSLFVIKGARSKYKFPDVNVLDYSPMIEDRP